MKSTTKTRLLVAAVLTSALGALGIGAAGAAAPCDRACKIAIADTYLAALVSHDGSGVKADAKVVRYENGSKTADGVADLKAGLSSPVMFVITGIRELTWDVHGDDLVAHYLLDTAPAPSYIAESFHLFRGLIQRIDAHFYIDAPGYITGPEAFATRPEGQVARFRDYNHGPLGPVPMSGNHGDLSAHPSAAGCAERCVTAAADSVLRALRAHDTKGMPMAPKVRVFTNRRLAASGVAAVSNLFRASNAVSAVKDSWLIPDGRSVTAMLTLTVGGKPAYTAARLTMEGAKISTIEIVCNTSIACIK